MCNQQLYIGQSISCLYCRLDVRGNIRHIGVANSSVMLQSTVLGGSWGSLQSVRSTGPNTVPADQSLNAGARI
jgi:hypothetical protein